MFGRPSASFGVLTVFRGELLNFRGLLKYDLIYVSHMLHGNGIFTYTFGLDI